MTEARFSILGRAFDGVSLERPAAPKLGVQDYGESVLCRGERILRCIGYLVIYGPRFGRPVRWLSSPKTDETRQIDALFVRTTWSPAPMRMVRCNKK